MKKAIIATALMTVACSHLRSQGIILNAGDTYTYQFTSLPLQGPYVPDPPPSPPFGRFDALFAGFVRGGSVLCELFENSTDEVPFASQSLTSPADLPPPPGPLIWANDAWQDLDGALRFTMLSGSVTITMFRVQVVRSEISGFTEYASTVVPGTRSAFPPRLWGGCAA